MLKNLLYMIIFTGSMYSCKQSNLKHTDRFKLKYVSSSDLAGYSSGSTISFYNNNLYLMGDDARNLIVLDTSLNITDSITLFSGSAARIKKSLKADIESSQWIGDKLYLFGSGSLSSRDSGFVFDPKTKLAERIELSSFYKNMREHGVKELNIEGCTLIKDQMMFASRRNLDQKINSLILSPGSPLFQSISGVVELTLPGQAGVSGLTYLAESDILLITASEEETHSAYGDGRIGQSYLGIIFNASDRLSQSELAPDQWIELIAIHKAFYLQKIESVCAINSGVGKKTLIFVADNDNGTTRLFRVEIQ